MLDDITINKAAIIRRCLARVTEEYRGEPSRLDNFTIQDAIVLKLLRACEASINLAMHRISTDKLGVPQSSRDAFEILHRNRAIRAETSTAMKHMVEFRDSAVHNYEKLQRPILQAIVELHLADFDTFFSEISPPTPQS